MLVSGQGQFILASAVDWFTLFTSTPVIECPPQLNVALNAVYFIDAQQDWAVGRDGTLLFTSDRGQSWQLQSRGASPWLPSLLSKQQSRQQNETSTKGVSLRADDGGKTWQIHNGDALEGVEAFSDNRDVPRGWVAGPEGRILLTSDAGKTWVLANQAYSRWPALWNYAAVLFALAIAALPLKAVAISTPHGLRIEERGQSDHPVETQREDKLDFWPVSQALSKFLRNRHTQPPLTVAMTGVCGRWWSRL